MARKNSLARFFLFKNQDLVWATVLIVVGTLIQLFEHDVLTVESIRSFLPTLGSLTQTVLQFLMDLAEQAFD